MKEPYSKFQEQFADTQQQIVAITQNQQRLQKEIDHLSQYQEVQGKLERLYAENQRLHEQLRKAAVNRDVSKASLKRLRQVIRREKRRFHHTQIELKRTNMQLQDSLNVIAAMQSSKFWRLRSKWFQLKAFWGKDTPEIDVNVSLAQGSTEAGRSQNPDSQRSNADQQQRKIKKRVRNQGQKNKEDLNQTYDSQVILPDKQQAMPVSVSQPPHEKPLLAEPPVFGNPKKSLPLDSSDRQSNNRLDLPNLFKLKNTIENLKVNSSRFYLDDFASRAGKAAANGALVLDAGAGYAPYKDYFSHAQYETADFYSSNSEITYKCDLRNIPVEDQKYDLVFCSQVLEHLPEPKLVLAEFFRILKPGGQLWMSAPLFYEEHEIPHDFYRYTQYGFTHLLESTGFKVKDIEWLEGYYGTLSYQFDVASRSLPVEAEHYGNGYKGGALAIFARSLKPVFALFSIFFARLDIRKKYVLAGQCKNYMIVATKPESIQRRSEQFWSDLNNHSPMWDGRTKAISEMIPPNSSVFEFGAGRMILKLMLDSSCTYNHHDLTHRTSDTFVFDLNSRPLPVISKHDFAVFSGVLEYVEDVPSLIQEISTQFHKIIVSYVVKELYPDMKIREKNGWVNSFDEPNIIRIFEASGYTLKESQVYEKLQKIFLFEKMED